MIDYGPVPETREALATYLGALGVREGSYHLFGAHVDDAFVMDRRREGWVVFYSERGGESSLSIHEREVDACADLLEEHVFFDLVAGPAPAAIADEAFDAWLNSRGVTREDLDPVDWKFDNIPMAPGEYWRRYFVRIAAARRLAQTP